MSVIGLVQLTTTDCAGSGEDLSTCREHILLSVIGLVQLTTTNKVSGQNRLLSVIGLVQLSTTNKVSWQNRLPGWGLYDCLY